MTKAEYLFLRRAEIPKTLRLLELFPDEKRDIRPVENSLTIELLDDIHHCGQFTIYSRMAGARVPQIYGPSRDEP